MAGYAGITGSISSEWVAGFEPVYLTPDDAEDKTVEWFSDNQPVATVSTNGVVNGVSEGSANIIATTTDGSYADTCVVTVGVNGFESDQITQTDIKLYPNPGTESFTLEGINSGIYTIRMLNLQGVEQFNQHSWIEPGSVVNIDQLPAGTYIIHIQNELVNETILFRKLDQ